MGYLDWIWIGLWNLYESSSHTFKSNGWKEGKNGRGFDWFVWNLTFALLSGLAQLFLWFKFLNNSEVHEMP